MRTIAGLGDKAGDLLPEGDGAGGAVLGFAGYTALASKVLRLLKSPRQVRLMNRSFGSLFVARRLGAPDIAPAVRRG